jgi:SAM-dependent methyltransferase
MGLIYAEDFAYIHHTGFGSFAERSAPELLSVLRHLGIHAGFVVDLGCGSGIWAQARLAAGYRVLAVDCAPAMIELARRRAPAADFVTASAYSVDLPPCVAVTAIGEGLTYIAPEDPGEVLPPFLGRIFEALLPGGVLVFDLVVRSETGPTRYRVRRSGVDWNVDVEVVEIPEQSILTRQITMTRRLDGGERRSSEVHRVRTFHAAEVERWLQSVGFEIERLAGYGKMPLPPQRVAFLARKPPAA